MNSILLLGAGFSRNWGGWLADEVFDYLLGCEEIVNDAYLKQILWKHKNSGGFEHALAQIQLEYRQATGAQSRDRLMRFQKALFQMFTDMQKGFAALPDFGVPAGAFQTTQNVPR